MLPQSPLTGPEREEAIIREASGAVPEDIWGDDPRTSDAPPKETVRSEAFLKLLAERESTEKAKDKSFSAANPLPNTPTRSSRRLRNELHNVADGYMVREPGMTEENAIARAREVLVDAYTRLMSEIEEDPERALASLQRTLAVGTHNNGTTAPAPASGGSSSGTPARIDAHIFAQQVLAVQFPRSDPPLSQPAAPSSAPPPGVPSVSLPLSGSTSAIRATPPVRPVSSRPFGPSACSKNVAPGLPSTAPLPPEKLDENKSP